MAMFEQGDSVHAAAALRHARPGHADGRRDAAAGRRLRDFDAEGAG